MTLSIHGERAHHSVDLKTFQQLYNIIKLLQGNSNKQEILHFQVLIYNNEQFKDTKIAEADPLISFVQEIPTDYVKADVCTS